MQRPDRFFSHAVVEVRRSRWLPFFFHSGILLDLSEAGFKAEIMGSFKIRPQDQLWLRLPLVGFGIRDLDKMDLQVEIKWIDEPNARIGGVFLALDADQKAVIAQVLATLAKHSKSKI